MTVKHEPASVTKSKAFCTQCLINVVLYYIPIHIHINCVSVKPLLYLRLALYTVSVQWG